MGSANAPAGARATLASADARTHTGGVRLDVASASKKGRRLTPSFARRRASQSESRATADKR